MKLNAILVAAAALLVGACSGESTVSLDEESSSTMDGVTESTEAEQPVDEVLLRSVVTMIDPPDVEAYMDGIRKREPELAVGFEEAELVELGQVACDMQVDAVTGGDGPDLTGRLATVIADRGYPPADAEDMANAIRNAVRATICEVEYVEA